MPMQIPFPRRPGLTLAADKRFDVQAFVDAPRARWVRPHMAIYGAVSRVVRRRETANDRSTTWHTNYGSVSSAAAHRPFGKLEMGKRFA